MKILAVILALSLPLFGITLFEEGRVTSAIVVPENPTEPVRFAAKELALWLGEASGLQWQISEGKAPEGLYPIHLGDSGFARAHGFDRETLEKDGYVIQATGEYMLIAGRDYPGGILQGFINPYRHVELYNPKLKLSAMGEMGTYFGVKHFLEEFLGIRYYMMGPDGTVCPHRDKLTLDAFQRRNAPAFAYRYAYFGFLSQYPEEALWYRRAGFGGDSPRDINHAYWMMEDQKDAHPEYFALIDGKRDTDSRSVLVHWGGNYCLSNPDLLQAWVKKICDYFKTHPQNILFPLSPNDGTYRVCECPECQAQVDLSMGEDGKFSNLVWGFTNRVAKEVGKRFPDRQIGTFAYEHYRIPPKGIDLEPNVATLICHTQRQQTDPEYKAHIRGVIQEWKHRLKHVYSYTYPHKDYWKPQRGYPSFYPRILQEDIQFERDEHIDGFFMESEFRMEKSDEFSEFKIYQPGLQHLTAYVTSKLEWNPDLNLKALLDEYYRLFYGTAEAPMRKFWEKAEAIATSHPFNMNTHPTNYYTRQDIQEFFDLLDEGLRLTNENSVYHRRIRQIKSEMEPYSGIFLHATALRRPIEFPVADNVTVTTTDALKTPPWSLAHKYQFNDPFGRPSTSHTELLTMADTEGLGLYFLCYEEHPEKLVKKATLRDQGMPWEDDCVEIFLEHQDGTHGMQLIITANGTLWDGSWADAKQTVIDSKWDCHPQVYVTRNSFKWIAVVKIPWSDLGVTLETAGTLRGNFYRTQVAGKPPVHSCIVPIMGFLHRNPDFFAPLKFPKRKQ